MYDIHSFESQKMERRLKSVEFFFFIGLGSILQKYHVAPSNMVNAFTLSAELPVSSWAG